jgi:hypothetical protein
LSVISYYISLIGSEYAALPREAAGTRIQGGTIYDALLLKGATKAVVTTIHTLSLKYFQVIAPSEAAGKQSRP